MSSPRPNRDFATEQVRAPATYELVVEHIRRALALGGFAPGDRLPAERELAQQLGVSRTTLREAVRVLEGEGMPTVKRGAAGGITVLGQREQDHSDEEIRRQAEAFEQIIEFRLANEALSASLAAQRRTDDEVDQFEQMVAELLDIEQRTHATADPHEEARLTTAFTKVDNDLHIAIARASRNPYVLDAIQTGRIKMLRPVGTAFGRLHKLANFQHGEIVACIREGDAEGAAAAMRQHVESTREQLREVYAQRI